MSKVCKFWFLDYLCFKEKWYALVGNDVSIKLFLKVDEK